ncbi:MAG TPA: hypothetical protein VFC92_00490 [Bacteroidales bacterium]|nr:hypothetical protein [Bacteroidales bacterium]
MKRFTTLLLLAMLPSGTLSAQDAITIEDYNRAIGYLHKNYYNKKVFNLNIRANWFPDSTGVWWIRQSADEKQFLKITFPDLAQSPLFDQLKLAQILSDSVGAEIEANDLPIDKIELKAAGKLLITARGKTWLLNTENHTEELSPAEAKTNDNEKASPDKKWLA